MKISLNVSEIMLIIPFSHKITILDNSSEKANLKKIFLVSNSTLDDLFNGTTHMSLYFLESLNLDISLSKTKIKKNFLIPYSTLDRLSNDTSLNSLRWIYRSAKIDWTKKPIWVYGSSPHKWGRNK